jgi:DNA repair photolyase
MPGRTEAQTHGGTVEAISSVHPSVRASVRPSFVHLSIKSILNSPEQTGLGFWSLNPYVGCEFGCTYCYARFAHRYVVERGREGGEPGAAEWTDEAFERQVFVKSEAPDVLALTLKPSRVSDAAIAIGTATDPYQPAERRFHLTRRILERLAQFHGLNVSIVTKSPLVARDVDVLSRLAERSRLTVYLSLITVELPLIRKLEARSPMPQVRLRALEKLVKGGIRAGVMIAPVLPGITDGTPQLLALMRAAKAAGAAFVHAEPLRLYPAIKSKFLPALARHFPALLTRYERAFDAKGIVRQEYACALERRVERLLRQTGFSQSTGASGAEEPVQWALPL